VGEGLYCANLCRRSCRRLSSERFSSSLPPLPSSSSASPPLHANATTGSLRRLQSLLDLLVDGEVLGDATEKGEGGQRRERKEKRYKKSAPVNADALALVQFRLGVAGRDALGVAGGNDASEEVRDGLEFHRGFGETSLVRLAGGTGGATSTTEERGHDCSFRGS
jgi:hypothetical protein